MKLRKLLIAGAIGTAGMVALAAPAGAVSQYQSEARSLKHTVLVKAGIPSHSINCVGPLTGKPGSRFTCYLYNAQNVGVLTIHGTGLGNGEVNMHLTYGT